MRRLILSSALVTVVMSLARPVLAQPGVPSFNIQVPKKSTPLIRLKVTVSIATMPVGGVAFNVTSPNGVTKRIPSAGTLKPGDPSPAGTDMCTGGGCSNPTDVVYLTPPAGGLPADDVRRRRFVFDVYLISDYDPNNFCAALISVTETWTIAVDGGSPHVVGVCATSYDHQAPNSFCSMDQPITPTGAPNQVAVVPGFSTPNGGCSELRPAVDVMLVLDKSGSMSSSTLGGTPQPKMQALAAAVRGFTETWDNIGPVSADQLGLVFFDQDKRWMKDVSIPAWTGIPDGLQSYATIKQTIHDNIGSVAPGGSTSIGDGLVAAAGAFDFTNGHRKAVLLMSNGMENTDLRVKVDNPTTPTQVQTYLTGNPGAVTAVPNQDKFQVYAVTVGTGAAVSADINEDIATATHGFYINTELSGDPLKPFFAELVQNFVKFNTWEMARLIQATVTPPSPYTGSFAVTSTSTSLLFRLTSSALRAPLRLTITPPGGATPIVRRGFNVIQLPLSIPPAQPYDPKGAWQFRIDVLSNIESDTPAPSGPGVPFEFTILTDDSSVYSDLTVLPADYAPGDPIRLQATVKYAGRRIMGIGSNPGDRLLVQLVKPGASLGDLLSTSTATPASPPPGETLSPGEAKLLGLLESNPGAFTPASDTVTLFDDGNPSHGDAVAKDGIYSGTITTTQAGHYNFLFGIEGLTPGGGRFSRQQLQTVHVRDIPASNQTSVTTAIQPLGTGSQLVVTMTPRNRFNHRMGPLWGNYFWLTAPGVTAFKMKDNLDGTYTASLPFTGAPPKVAINFLRVSTLIDDSVTPDHLPVPLDSKTVIIPDVRRHRNCFGSGTPFASILVGGLLLLGVALSPRLGRRR